MDGTPTDCSSDAIHYVCISDIYIKVCAKYTGWNWMTYGTGNMWKGTGHSVLSLIVFYVVTLHQVTNLTTLFFLLPTIKSNVFKKS